MAGTEAVEEVDERNPAFDGSQMGNAGQVHDFLGVGFCQHGAAGGTGAHDVLVVAENGEGMVGQCAGSDVEYARQQFACHFIHIWNHEEHPLGCGIGGGQGTALEGAVKSAGSAAFGLHFHNVNRVAENVLLSVGGPFIHRFRHGRGRGNRINGSYFSECVGNIRSSCISIHCFYFSHRINNSFSEKQSPCFSLKIPAGKGRGNAPCAKARAVENPEGKVPFSSLSLARCLEIMYNSSMINMHRCPDFILYKS